jgi:predicted Zn finger-like uncharacterized protein
MLLVCDNCQAKIRVPDTAAGKKVKCPKCATVLQVPAADVPPEAPAPAPPPAPAAEPVAETPPPAQGAGPKPSLRDALEDMQKRPPRASTPRDEDEAIEAEAPRPRSRARDDDEGDAPRRRSRARDEDDEDDRPSRRRGGRDDDDDLVRRSRRSEAGESTGLSVTSMILGITSLAFGSVGGCCCWFVALPLAGLCAIGAIVTGFMGQSRGGRGMALTGIITGGIGLVLIVLWAALLLLGFTVGNLGEQKNFNQQWHLQKF